MADFTLTLGGVVFQDFEVPERISGLGGEQLLVIQKLVGGDRDVQALGRDDAAITWTGRFRSSSAIDRARAVDAMRVAGQQVTLTFGDFSYTVVIERFVYDLERIYEVPYAISLVVVADNGASGTDVAPDADEMLQSDNGWASDLGDDIDDDTLSGLLSTLSAVIGSVPSFATAARSTLQSVIDPLGAVQAQVSTLIAADETVLTTFQTTGVAAGSSPNVLGSSLMAAASAMTQVASLYDLQNVVGRMATNIAAIGGSGAWITVAGGTLESLALQYYGDASEWPTIAAANGLTDPVLTGVMSILIPPRATGAQGVLSEVNPAPVGAAQAFPLGQTVTLTGTASATVGTLDFTDPANSDLLGAI